MTTWRYIPDDWLTPLDPAAVFGEPGRFEVDLGCGKGRFLLARAEHHPGTRLLGIDRMLKRIRKIDNKLNARGIANVRLLRIEAYYAVTYLMPKDAVSTCYLFFPDPWPKKKHHGNRLFNERFLDGLERMLSPGGVLHVATDHLPYFEDIRGILSQRDRLTESKPFVPAESEQTDFERWYLGKKEIGRCSFTLRD